ncbi:hypothetical protein PSHT_14171 [Puccinia striiformis]|uniref:methylmalonate-semialdehyde dehydrogenase (CoA acylating) n=1 Tax=Puccinia striiformis TaxID=27350 RepID=A0A2S4ULH8_9BASI|nr:hypothetical protein PSHT_14171 [Puccinia striiformis]
MLSIRTRVWATHSAYQHYRWLSGSASINQQSHTFSRSWKGTSTNGQTTKLYTDGQFIDSQTGSWFDVHNPRIDPVGLRAIGYSRDLNQSPQVDHPRARSDRQSCSRCVSGLENTSILSRQQIMIRLQALIKEHQDDLARSIVLEQGKTFSDAKGDVHRGLQVVEAACSLPQLLMGEKLEVSKDMDTETRKAPLGVTAAICPFNFPAMIPLWNILSVACGNSLILKPSERDPGASMMIAELASMAGLPAGVLSIAHGGVETVNYICDHPAIKAISFVGSDHAGKHIYSRAGANGKRVQANLGAKNHCVVMPDASKNLTLNSITGAAFGAAGQRCMALSVMITVGKSAEWVDELVERASKLKLGEGFQEQTEVGPVISPQSKARIISLIDASEKEGGKILLDGRKVEVHGYPNGNWVGPTIIQASPGMSCYEEEIFGPVLTIVNVSNLDEAIELINRNKCTMGTVPQSSPGTERRREDLRGKLKPVKLGSTCPCPYLFPCFAWSGNKGSVLGGHSLYGKLGIEFWTQNKTTTALWRSDDAVGNRADVSMPTHR